jgi:hypothetical protein
MTVLIPMIVGGVLMGAIGYYFARHEGELQQAKPQRRDDIRLTNQPPAIQAPDAARAQQSSQMGPQGPQHGVPLHP